MAGKRKKAEAPTRLDNLAERFPELVGSPTPEWSKVVAESGLATGDTMPLTVRVPKSLVAALDEVAEELKKQAPWRSGGRSDVVRLLLMRAICGTGS